MSNLNMLELTNPAEVSKVLPARLVSIEVRTGDATVTEKEIQDALLFPRTIPGGLSEGDTVSILCEVPQGEIEFTLEVYSNLAEDQSIVFNTASLVILNYPRIPLKAQGKAVAHE